MSLRRTAFAFAVTFVCALIVFTLPRLAFNTVRAATAQHPDTTAASPTVAPVRADTLVAPPAQPRSLPTRLVGLFGIVAILGIGVALSSNRKAISWRVVGWGVGLQAAFAILVLRVPIGQRIFQALGRFVTAILGFSYVGSEFVFGEVGKQHSSLA